MLADHPRRGDVVAALIERDPDNVEIARATAAALGLHAVTVVEGDAGCTDSYAGAVPASVVILSGFFDYLSADDLGRLIRMLPLVCARGSSVVWVCRTNAATHPPASIRARFEAAEFRTVSTGPAEHSEVYVGVERFEGAPLPFRTGMRLFSFRDPRRGRSKAALRRVRTRATRIRQFVSSLGN